MIYNKDHIKFTNNKKLKRYNCYCKNNKGVTKKKIT